MTARCPHCGNKLFGDGVLGTLCLKCDSKPVPPEPAEAPHWLDAPYKAPPTVGELARQALDEPAPEPHEPSTHRATADAPKSTHMVTETERDALAELYVPSYGPNGRTMVDQLRFEAFCAGWDQGAQSERARAEALAEALEFYAPESAKWDNGLKETTPDQKGYQPFGMRAAAALAEWRRK